MLNLRARSKRFAFTLVELMVVLAVIGVLAALVLPAVQFAREAARRTTCKNNLRQMGLALHEFHATRNHFPAGNDSLRNLDHSWVASILPYLDQGPLSDGYDFLKSWFDGSPNSGNCAVAETVLPMFRCPSFVQSWTGDSDYGGILGSSLSGLPFGTGPGQAWGSGVLIATNQFQPDPIQIGQVLDGTSTTILVTESADRPPPHGRWANGTNCFGQENGGINTQQTNGIHSYHTHTAPALMADGSVQILVREMDLYVLGALCTRDGSEAVKW